MDLINWASIYRDEVKDHIVKHGVSDIDKFLNHMLKRWQDTGVNIGITGDSGTGKSSFINSFRGILEDDERAAPVGVTETTKETTVYDHPANPNIKLWDLPGFGTPNYSDLEKYCKTVELEKYHVFLIISASRFTENDLKLAKKVRSIKKNFFFIRTKIDNDVRAEKRKGSFNERAMLKEIRQDCAKKLNNLLSQEQDIFLISSHYPSKWDFDRLTKAILGALKRLERESLTLSLGVLRSLSTEVLKKKVELLKGRIWMVAASSAVASTATVPFPFLEWQITLNEVALYRSQLGTPGRISDDFSHLTRTTKDKVLKTFSDNFVWDVMVHRSAIESVIKEIPLIGGLILSPKVFYDTCHFLEQRLELVEDAALSILKDAAEIRDLKIDRDELEI